MVGLRYYDIGTIVDVTTVKDLVNTTLRVATRTPDGVPHTFAVRIHRGHLGPQAIDSELQFLEWLSGRGGSVPRPVRDREGQLAIILRGLDPVQDRSASLFDWIDGRSGSVAERWKPQRVRQHGKLLGDLHHVSSEYQPPTGFLRPVWGVNSILREADPTVAAKWGRNRNGDWLHALQRTVQWLEPREVTMLRRAADIIDETLEGTSSDRLIHGDPNPSNVLFTDRGPHLIDFDDCGWGWPEYDLAVPLFWLWSDPDAEEQREMLLDGYAASAAASVQPELLPASVALRAFGLLRWGTGNAVPPDQQQWVRALCKRAVRTIEVIAGDGQRHRGRGGHQIGARRVLDQP